jgi:RNA polymerase sigma-70 factor (ECF subfamily)
MSCAHEHGNGESAEGRPQISSAVVQTLVDNHRAFLSFLEHRLGDRALAEDILQEAFARGLARIETLRDGESVIAWFYRALRNAVIDHHRRRGATDRALQRLAGEMEGAAQADAETHDAVCKCVSQLLDTLKPEYRQALRRLEIDGLTMQQFAAESGVTANNAAVRVHRARQALRAQVSLCCGTCAEHGCLDCHCDASKRPAAAPSG